LGYEVNGYFTDNGQGMVFYLADREGKIVPGTLYSGQRHEQYNYSWFPTMGAGKTHWNNIAFGSLVNRRSIPHRPSNTFNRAEWIGAWNMNHDGWQGVLTINAISSFIWGLLMVNGTYRTHDGRVLNISGWVNSTHQHIMSINIPFAADNNQAFELHYHTWEDGIFSGTTVWAGRKFGVFGNKS
jgi:hypothetical protein